MIAYLRGKIAFIQDESIIVDVQGVGYEVICANPYAFQTSMNEEAMIYTYHHVRDDAQLLYGFKTEDEKFLFKKLISVSGIGPKSGITILGSIHVPEFVAAVEQEDEKFLMSFPGIGKKTARQIILDLKGKLTNVLTIGNVETGTADNHQDRVQLKEVQDALKSLGYTDQEIRKVVPDLQKSQTENIDELIRLALSLMAKQ